MVSVRGNIVDWLQVDIYSLKSFVLFGGSELKDEARLGSINCLLIIVMSLPVRGEI